MKQSNLIKLCAILLFVLISNSVSFAQFGGGSGTQNAPYQIYTNAHLLEIADSVANYIPNRLDKTNWSKGKYFILMNDIDDTVRVGIGCYSANLNPDSYYKECVYFQGDFDGNDKKITLAIDSSICRYPNNGYGVGLFAMNYEANIYDLTVDGYFTGELYVGGICGFAERSRISNCVNLCNSVDLDYNHGFMSIGGIVGEAIECTISNCINYGNIENRASSVGGIAGVTANGNSIIGNCINYGDIKSTGNTIGGICGNGGNENFSDAFLGCHNYGDITGGSGVGGVTGCLSFNSNLSHCTNTGDITGTSVVGGIAGFFYNQTELSYCINIGTVRGDSVVGGIVGCYNNMWDQLPYGNIHNCHNAGLVVGKSTVGGIQGDCWGTITNSLNTGVVIGETNAGGIAGVVDNSKSVVTIENCHYDKQMCIHGGIAGNDVPNQAEGYLTKELIGNNLIMILGVSGAWTFNNANLYPTLIYYERDSVALVASSPVYLYDGDVSNFDRQNKVRTDFKVNLENDVKWNRIVGNVDIVNEDGLLRNDGSDTLVCSIGNYKKLVPINMGIKTIDVKDTFLLTLYANPEEGGSVTGAGKYAHDSLATITATANPCYQFVNWTDSATGAYLSDNPTLEFTFPNYNLTLIANFVRDSFDLALAVNPANAGKASGAGRFACGDDTYRTIEAVPSDACFAFKNWTDEDGNVISENAKDSVVVARNTVLTANFSNVCDIHFTIWATERKLVAPSRRNYRIPIYIKSNEDVPADLFAINKLVIEIDNRIFYPKRTNTGTLAGKNQNEITIENITIPALNAGEEVVLFNLIGDVLLGTVDSSEIIINQNVEFSGDFNSNPEIINGSITLDICREGSDRFVGVADKSPSLTIKNNPAHDILEVECNVVESGKYVLEVVDMTGRSVKVEEFVAGGAMSQFYFTLSTENLGAGNYLLVLNTPTGKYSVVFVVKK